MYQFKEGQVLRNGYSTIPYTWIRSEKRNQAICIMLPGLGYTTQRPLFHYATGMCLEQNVDVLHINYNFAKNEKFKKTSEAEQNQWMYEDVKAVVEDVLKGTDYNQCFLLSKSIGTIPMAVQWTQKNYLHNMIGIWLTPLLKDENVYQALLNTDQPSLCVIGDQDHHFIEKRVHSLKNNQLVSTVVIPNANHSLEIDGNLAGTLDAVKVVMESVQAFMVRHKIC
jgi:pimeloyl-ACP methyl ester carboxylesterase